MKSKKILYSCNVTLSPAKIDVFVDRLSFALDETLKMLGQLQIKGVFYIDTEFLLQVKKTMPQTFLSITKSLKKIDTKGHSLALLINPVWEGVSDIHRINPERLLDIFAQGKHLLKDCYYPKAQERIQSIRVINSKIQPFVYLQDVYQMLGIKVDASILPRIKKSMYFDFSSVRYGEAIKFTDNPNVADRFGKYLGLSRAYFSLSTLFSLQIKKQYKKLLKADPNYINIYIRKDKHIPELVDMPVPNEKKYKILSPDVVILSIFQKIMDSQRMIIKHICVLESFIDDVSNLTQKNLQWLKENSVYKIVSLKEVVNEYSTTYNIRLK